MSQAVIGLVAHVDAGKTTLAEALLYRAGAIRRQGRVDKGDAHLDTPWNASAVSRFFRSRPRWIGRVRT